MKKEKHEISKLLKRLIEIRKAKHEQGEPGMSAAHISKHVLGGSHAYWSMVERGNSRLHLDTAEKVAEYLGCKIDLVK